LALNITVYEFPVVLSDIVHVPKISPAVPLDLDHVSVHPSGYTNIIVVAVTVVTVKASVPNCGPSHIKSVLVQVIVRVDVVGLQVYVPLAVCVPVASAGVADTCADSTFSPEALTV